jgi:hypothetical protein
MTEQLPFSDVHKNTVEKKPTRFGVGFGENLLEALSLLVANVGTE